MLLDLIVLVVIVLAALGGWRLGGAAIAVHIVGLLVGLVVGLQVAGLLASSLSPPAHVVLGVVCALGGLLLGGALGKRVGVLVTALLARVHLGVLDRAIGAVARGLGAAVAIWIALALVVSFGPESWIGTVRSSALADLAAPGVHGLTDLLQAAAPDDVAALVPAFGGSPPSAAAVRQVERTVASSVFLVETRGCKGDVVGTGFAAGDGLVVTNAHVVRGASDVTVRTSSGEQRATTVVYDRRADLAVLRVDSLAARPLRLAVAAAGNGTPAVVVGYPHGGPRTAVGAVVAQRLPVPDPGFSDGLALHQTYRLDAVIVPGNSGSPLLTTGGRVLGVVNASSGSAGSQGFAVTADELAPDLRLAGSRTAAVSTGTCT